MSRNRAWLALALLPLLGGCIGAVAIPLVAGGSLMAVTKHRVRAATPVPQTASAAKPKKGRKPKAGKAPEEAGASSPRTVVTSLKELPPPSGAPADDRWQRFFAYAAGSSQTEGTQASGESALLVQPPSLDSASRQPCSAPVRAVVLDLDEGPQPFVPERLTKAPAEVAAGLAQLRSAGFVVLWISRLPAVRAADVARALRTSGFDPQGQDQLLLVRNGDDRKQLLREDASKDVCIVAIAGGERGDFDELFDYLRNRDAAFGLDSMIDHGWFLVPSLAAPATPSQ